MRPRFAPHVRTCLQPGTHCGPLDGHGILGHLRSMLTVPHGTPPRAGLNVPGGERGGSRPSTLPRQQQSAAPNTMADYARRIKQLEDKLQDKEDERRSRGRAGARPPRCRESQQRRCSGSHLSSRARSPSRRSARRSHTRSPRRRSSRSTYRSHSRSRRPCESGLQRRSRTRTSSRRRMRSRSASRHRSARRRSRSRSRSRSTRRSHAPRRAPINDRSFCTVRRDPPWSHNTLPWERTTVIIIIPHEQRSSPTAACRPILSVPLVRELRGRTYPSQSTCVAYLTWP